MAAHAALRSASVGRLSVRCQHEELAFFSPLQAYNCQPEAPFWHLLQPTIHCVGPLSTPSSPCRASPPSAPRGRTVPMAASDRLTGSRDTISRAPRPPAEPHDAGVDSQVHTSDQCIQQGMGKSLRSPRSVFGPLQLCSRPHRNQSDALRGDWAHRSWVDTEGVTWLIWMLEGRKP
jgi:hypothetical protein